MVDRISTGIKDLDNLMQGGFPKSSLTLVTGTPGTGKSILCSQIAYANAQKNKKCLYIDLEQKEGQLKNQLIDFGLSSTKAIKNINIITIPAFESSLIEGISKEITKGKYDIIIIDSIEAILNSSAVIKQEKKLSLEQIQESVIPTTIDTESMGRLKLTKLFSDLSNTNANIFAIAEKVEGKEGLSRDTISEFLCDNIINMNYLGVGSSEYRSLQIRKMRRSGHEKGSVLFEINKKGIKIIKEKTI